MMSLPFTTDQFFAVFRAYNLAVWPAQVVLLLMAIAAAGVLLSGRSGSGRIVCAILALLWAWMGIVYHLVFFTGINPAAWGFGALFLVEAGLLAWFGVIRADILFRPGRHVRSVTGFALALFALAGYPALSVRLNHPYPDMPTFGLPCPTTIFTIGLLLQANRPLPVLVVPLLWSAIGAVAAFQLDVAQDLGLLAAGVIGLLALVISPERVTRESPA